MDYFGIKFFSSCLELVGVFFLSIEAIKLENIRKLQSSLKSRMKKLATKGLTRITGSAVGFTALLVMRQALKLSGKNLSEVWVAFREFVPGPFLVDASAAGVVGILVFLVTGSVVILGLFLIFGLALSGLSFAVISLEFAEKNTASGLTGITGFFLYLIGVCFRFIEQ